MRPVARRIVSVKRTRRAIRREEKAERDLLVGVMRAHMVLNGGAERIREATGVDITVGTPFGPLRPPVPSVDAGAGFDSEPPAADQRTPSEHLTDHIRQVVNDPERKRERLRLKAGGSHDARDVPENTPGAVSYPPVRWEDR